MKSPLNLLDGLGSLVRSRGDDPRGATVDPTGPQVAGGSAKAVSPAQAKKFDALLAEAVENEASSAPGGKATAGSIAKAAPASIAKTPLSTTGNTTPESGLDAAQVASTDTPDAPASKPVRATQPGRALVAEQVAAAVSGDADSLVEEVPLKTTPRAPAKDLSRETQNVLPSGPSSFHSTISHAAKQAAREVTTGTMAAPPEAESALAAPLPASTSGRAKVEERDTESRDHGAELTVEDAAPVEEQRAPSAPLAAVLENIAALVSRIVAPPPAAAASASMEQASTEAPSLKLEPAHGDVTQEHDSLRATPQQTGTPADAQAFRELAAQATSARAANTNHADSPRANNTLGVQTQAATPGTQDAPLGSTLSPLGDTAAAQDANVRSDAGAGSAPRDAVPALAGRQTVQGANGPALHAAQAMPQQGVVTLSAAEQAAVSRATASMVQSASAPQQTTTAAAPRAGLRGPAASAAGATTNTTLPTAPGAATTTAPLPTGPGVVSTNTTLPTSTGTTTAKVVVTAERAGTTPATTGTLGRGPATAQAAAPAPEASSTAPTTTPSAASAGAPNAAPEGLRSTAGRAPAEAAPATTSATPGTAAAPSPTFDPVLVPQEALAQASASASAASAESSSAKDARVGEPSSDGPIAPLRGFSRGAFVGHALSAYGGRGHESAEQQTRGRFSEERESRPETTRTAEPNIAADLNALAQHTQPTPEAAPAPIASPQPAAPMAPPQPIVDVPNVEFAARPPASQNENASISLHHPDLGPIRLDVQRTAGRIEVHAVLESVHAEAVLRANESGIRQSVQQSGMTFSALRVRVRGEETNPLRQAQVRRRRANERET